MRLLGIELNNKRVFGLDILRAIAILTVVYVHGKEYASEFIPIKVYNFFRFDGVTAFFVLSGFLIGGILIKIMENTEFRTRDIFNFWIRRWFRTIPNYVLILICIVIIYKVTGQTLHNYYLYPFFLQTAFKAQYLFFPESWSLTVEEWFYFLTPLYLYTLIHFFKFKRKSALLFSIITIILASTIVRLYRYYHFDIDTISELGIYTRRVLIARLDSIMYGVFGAYVFYYHPAFWKTNKLVLLIIGLLLLFSERIIGAAFPDQFQHEIDFNTVVLKFSQTSIGVLFTIPYLNSIKTGKGILYKVITYISLISYALYVVHLSIVKSTIIPILEDYIEITNSLLIYVLYWAISIVLATLLFKYYEKPMTNLRDKVSFGKTKSKK